MKETDINKWATLTVHQIRTAHQAGLECPPRSNASGRKRSGAGMGCGHSSGRRLRRKEKTRSAEYDQIVGGNVFSGRRTSRRVAAKDRRIPHEETQPDRHRTVEDCTR